MERGEEELTVLLLNVILYYNEYHYCQIIDNPVVFRIFISFLRFSFDCPSYLSSMIFES